MAIGQDKHKIVSFQFWQTWNQGSASKNFETNTKNRKVHVCGFLVVDNDDIVTIAQQESNDFVTGQLVVPKQCIVKDTFKVHYTLPKLPEDVIDKEDKN